MATTKGNKNNDYTGDNITILEGLEAVRLRPAMYIGDTEEKGLHHLVYEIVSNAIDEGLAGYATSVKITLEANGGISIEDDGRGIPVDINTKTGLPAVEAAATLLHAGGKFDRGSYKVSGGLHGVGLTVTNALSNEMSITVWRDGFANEIKFSRGKTTQKLTKTKTQGNEQGTKVYFLPDPEIFRNAHEFNLRSIFEMVRRQAYLTAGMKFVIIDNRTENAKENDKDNIEKYLKGASSFTFFFEGGVKSYVMHLNLGEKILNAPFYVRKSVDGTEVEVSLQYKEEFDEQVLCFTNNILNLEGGTHLQGFRIAVTKGINDYFEKNKSEREKDLKLSGEDVREGLTAVISVKVAEPQFEGQTKMKLNNPEVVHQVRAVVEEGLKEYFDQHPKDAQNIISRAVLTSKARAAAKAAREAVTRKGILDGGGLPGKLADCSSKFAAESEIFIVEGDSAGGSAKQGRDRKTQAILPLFGKPLNVEKARIDKVVDQDKLKTLIISLGAGIGDTFDIAKLKYHKIVIMADADVDGAHIATLYMTFFFRYMKQVVEQGYLYIAQPPLYRIELNNGEVIWVQDDEDKERNLKELAEKGRAVKSVQRFKGLGEMNSDQLWETTMNPKNRTLKRITIEDAEEANKIFDILMGEEVLPRKKFIQTHAAEAELDV